jgi:hypothetical protein
MSKKKAPTRSPETSVTIYPLTKRTIPETENLCHTMAKVQNLAQ